MIRQMTAAVAASFALPAAAQTADIAALRREMQQMREQYEQTLKTYETKLGELEQRLRAAETKAAAPAPVAAPQTASTARTATSASAFNPSIGAILDGKFGYFAKNTDTYRLPGFSLGEESSSPGDRGFALGESELNLAASVDQALYGSLTIAFEREGDVSVEEAFIQTTSLPWGFTLKAGRFLSRPA